MNWIDVSDELPKNCQHILMTYNDLVMCGYYFKEKFYHPSSCAHAPGYCNCDEQEGIEYWMKLPEAPKD